MTNSPDYYAGYGGYELAAEPEGNTQRARALWIATAVLGLLTFGVSFGSPVTLGWAVWFSVLAAVIAGIGLLPRQGDHGWPAAALAVTGFLVALSTWLNADDAGGAGWAVVVIVVLNLLQGAVALAALLLGGEDKPAQSGPDYAAYAQYMQAYQAYAQYQQVPPAQTVAQGQATAQAQAHGAATAQARGVSGARADAAQDSYEALQQRYQQAGYPPAPQQRGAAGAPAPAVGADPGIPSYGRGGAAGVQQPGVRGEEPGEVSSN